MGGLNAMLKIFKIFDKFDKVDFYLTPQGIGMKKPVIKKGHKIIFESVLYTEAGITEIQSKAKQNNISDS